MGDGSMEYVEDFGEEICLVSLNTAELAYGDLPLASTRLSLGNSGLGSTHETPLETPLHLERTSNNFPSLQYLSSC